MVTVAAHFYYIKAFIKAMEAKETLKGESGEPEWGCHGRKHNKKGKKENKKA